MKIFLIMLIIFSSSLIIFSQNQQITIDPEGHILQVTKLVFSNNEKYLFSSSIDKTIRMFDLSAGRYVKTFRVYTSNLNIKEGIINAIAISPDDKIIVCGGYIKGSSNEFKLKVYDINNGNLINVLKGHKAEVLNIEFSADGKYLVSSDANGEIIVWDPNKNFSILHRLNYHKKEVYALSINSKNNLLISGSFDRSVAIWNLKSGEIVNSKEVLIDNKIKRIEFYPLNDEFFAITTIDGKVDLFYTKTLLLFRPIFFAKDSNVSEIKFTPDGKYLLFGGDYSDKNKKTKDKRTARPIFYYNITNNLIEDFSFNEHNTAVNYITVSKSGKYTASTGGMNNEIFIYDTNSTNIIHKLISKGEPIYSLGIFTDPSNDNITYIYFGNNFDKKGNNASIINRRISLKDYKVESKIDKKFVRYYDYIKIDQTNDIAIIYDWNQPYYAISTNKKPLSLPDKSDLIRSYTLTPNGKYAYLGSDTGIYKYNPLNSELLTSLIGHIDYIAGLTVSKDNKYLISGSKDQTIKIWNVETNENLLTIFIATNNDYLIFTNEGFYNYSGNCNNFLILVYNYDEDKDPMIINLNSYSKILFKPDIIKEKYENKDISKYYIPLIIDGKKMEQEIITVLKKPTKNPQELKIQENNIKFILSNYNNNQNEKFYTLNPNITDNDKQQLINLLKSVGFKDSYFK